MVFLGRREGIGMKLNEDLPVDHRLSTVYRAGAVLVGAFLILFGILGFLHTPSFSGHSGGSHVVGLSNNGLLAGLSVLVGAILIIAGLIGGNVASTVNTVVGLLFLLNGLVHLAVLRTSLNYFGFEVRNVIFSFVVGLALLTFGLYGRVSGGLSRQNPYWRVRHGLSPLEEPRNHGQPPPQ